MKFTHNITRITEELHVGFNLNLLKYSEDIYIRLLKAL
jgi:hypothetical protein